MVLGGEDYIKSDNIDSHHHHTSVPAVGSETDAQYIEMLKMLSVNQDNGMDLQIHYIYVCTHFI